MARESLGIVGYDSFHFAVENVERSRDFYKRVLDFNEVAKSSASLTERSGQQSYVLAAGDVRVVVSHPVRPNCKAARFLRKHPCGVMSLSFVVRDAAHAMKLLEERGATLLSNLVEDRDDAGGVYRSFEIATPLGDLNYRFLEKREYQGFAPGFEALDFDASKGNRYGISSIDHVTSNMRTMAPFLLWLEHVLGFERYWEVKFHTEDVKAGNDHGSGLKSIVMWERESGVKFANNEPLRPFFNDSQIARFVEDNAGAGVQHAALAVTELIPVVRDLRSRGVEFLTTPGGYYDALPELLRGRGITNLKEPLEVLRELEILVDGAQERYMLQIFMKEAAGLYHEAKAGPFFFELIQRGGHQGFGEGNFRSLFEAIEREQQAAPG